MQLLFWTQTVQVQCGSAARVPAYVCCNNISVVAVQTEVKLMHGGSEIGA